MSKSRAMESQKLINEKTLQRYIYETFAYGTFVHKMYPEKFKKYFKNHIKVIIPEFPIMLPDGKIHNTDFRIIFKDNTSLNIEVEWKTSRFNHGEVVYDTAYKDNKGFLLVLENDKKQSYISDENVICIDPEQFSFWFLKRAKHIIDGTISNYVNEYNSRSRKNWVVFLPSKGKKGGKSLNDFREKGLPNKKWAFRFSTKKPVLKNVFDIIAGDIVIFISDIDYSNIRGRELYVEKDWHFTGLDIVRVSNGFYCDFTDDTFESDVWKNEKNIMKKIESKMYMHYFDFITDDTLVDNKLYSNSNKPKVFPIYSLDQMKVLGGWCEFVDKLRWSCNNEGAPAEVSDEAYYSILMQTGDF